jgi:hypothetical protein
MENGVYREIRLDVTWLMGVLQNKTSIMAVINSAASRKVTKMSKHDKSIREEEVLIMR